MRPKRIKISSKTTQRNNRNIINSIYNPDGEKVGVESIHQVFIHYFSKLFKHTNLMDNNASNIAIKKHHNVRGYRETLHTRRSI